MRESKEFNHDGDASVENVVKNSGPLGILPILLVVSLAAILLVVLFMWWR
jgi:hypothetical protein